MADVNNPVLSHQLDIGQLLLEAQTRWLRPAEICEILKNYRMFQIQSEPPTRPPSGSVFLFDRKVLRYFRKDGHNWRKKKDGKTIKEAHERLKAGSIDVLHCYYAHGEEDENFQRRSYWMLEEDLMHIVFVHYRNVKGGKASSSRTREVQPVASIAQDDTPVCSNTMTIHNQMISMDSESPHSAQSSECEDTETDNYQSSTRYNSFLEVSGDDIKTVADTNHVEPYIPINVPDPLDEYKGIDADFIAIAQEDAAVFNEFPAMPSSSTDEPSWDTLLKQHPVGTQSSYFSPFFTQPRADKNAFYDDLTMDEFITKLVGQDDAEWQLTNSGNASLGNHDGDSSQSVPVKIGKTKRTSLVKQLSLEFPNGDGDGLKKYDSFSRWMSKELEEVDESCVQSSSGICWDEVENESGMEVSSLSHQGAMDPYVLSPSLSHDQLYSIIEFSPCWACADSQTQVLVRGTFLTSKEDIERCQWSCMFGEVEVRAEVVGNGILQCYTPRHRTGRVPFYVTCSNRLACSEVREFEFVTEVSQYKEDSEIKNKFASQKFLQMRFEEMLSMDFPGFLDLAPDHFSERALICNKISSLFKHIDGAWSSMANSKSHNGLSSVNDSDILLQRRLKEKLHSWLLHKVEDGDDPRVLDKEGQCIIHLAAALDYDWAMGPIMVAGVPINFRDVAGWTALHWAAFYGREKTVIALMSLDADPGLLTDPTSEFPSGRTPADLASGNGHKGIAGFLAKSSLTSHLSALTFKESTHLAAADYAKAPDGIVERNTYQLGEGVNDDMSLRDSLSAVCTATQAVARIHQAFRMYSFQRKNIMRWEDESNLSNEHVQSLVSAKANKWPRNVDHLHAAAVRIQNKFRGWKGRREFIQFRQRIIKVQAYVRGHQVRKRKKFFWTIGIVQKVVLWRRKGRGLHIAQSDAPVDEPCSSHSADDDTYDLLKEGRKRAEVKLEKALARVKSMVQYPEARDQYRRLVDGVEEYKNKATLESILNDLPMSIDMEMITEIEELVGEDAEMPLS